MERKNCSSETQSLSYAESQMLDSPIGHRRQPICGTSIDSKSKNQAKLWIPKYRFDSINHRFKETVKRLDGLKSEIYQAYKRVEELEKAILEAKIETALAVNKAKNLTAAKALVDLKNIKLEQDGTVLGLEEEVLCIKNSQKFLFESH